MASLSDVLLPMPTRGGQAPGAMSHEQMIQSHPRDAYGNITQANPLVPDPRETAAPMLNNYPQERIPQNQQGQMAKAREFANMYQFAAKMKGNKNVVQRLAAGIVNLGIQPPTLGELYGPAAAQTLSPEEAQMMISPEDYAKLMVQDDTGEVFQDAMSRIR